MDTIFDKYPVQMKLKISDGATLVLFSSYESEDKYFPEIMEKELFLFDNNENVIWSLDINEDEFWFYNEVDKVKQRRFQKTWFCYIYKKNNHYYIQNINGFIFEIDISTGKGTFSHWEKI